MFEAPALAYAELGWCVFPLARNSKIPAIAKSKGGQGVHDATCNPDRIRAWAKSYPHANIGVACGSASGFLVVDVDPRNGGNVALAKLAQSGRMFPPGPRARTGNGGLHILLKFDPLVGGNKDKLGRGIDVKSAGGYFVAAPSHIAPSANGPGGAYVWLTSPTDVAIPRMPLWMSTLLRPKPRLVYRATEATGDIASPTKVALIGDSHAAMFFPPFRQI